MYAIAAGLILAVVWAVIIIKYGKGEPPRMPGLYPEDSESGEKEAQPKNAP